MKPKLFLFLLVTAVFCNATFSQGDIVIRGIVFEQETNQPLAFVSTGIINKPLGTLTDTIGNFNFKIKPENLTDTLQISLVGYFPKRLAVKDFIAGNNKTISLNVKVTELTEVTVTTRKIHTEVLGRQGSGKLLQVSVHNKKSADETIGSEMGMRYKTNLTNAILKDFNFYIAANNFNSIKFRVNIYSVKNDLPDTLLFNKQLFATINNFKTGWTALDLERYNIEVPSDFVVTVQWVESKMDKPGKPITIVPVAMTPFSKNCYVRIASQDKWKRMGVRMSNFITLVY